MRTAVGAMGAGAMIVSLGASARAQGLQPPPPMGNYPPATPNGVPPQGWGPASPPSGQGSTQQRLDNAEAEDSGRGFEIAYVNAEAGGAFVNLGKDINLDQTSGAGGMFGVGAGLRFLTWTLGARARAIPVSAFTLYQINGEVGFHLPLGAWDPYVSLHGGYVTSALNSAAAPAGFPVPHGFDVGASVGGDYYVSALLSFGLDVTADALFLKRDATALDAARLNTDVVTSHSSTGFALLGSAHVGLHFDL